MSSSKPELPEGARRKQELPCAGGVGWPVGSVYVEHVAGSGGTRSREHARVGLRAQRCRAFTLTLHYGFNGF